jgi:hypothetical protein
MLWYVAQGSGAIMLSSLNPQTVPPGEMPANPVYDGLFVLLLRYKSGVKTTSPMFRDAKPHVSSYESRPASGQLATHSGRNDETDPTNDKISLNILLSNDGLVQKPLEPLQQGQRISMQPSKCFKSEGLEGDRRLLTRQQDSIASLLVLGSARGGPTRHEVQQVGNCEWGRANDVDMEVTPLLPRVEAEVCATALLARDRGGKGGFPGDPLTSRGKDSVQAVTIGVMADDNCNIPP